MQLEVDEDASDDGEITVQTGDVLASPEEIEAAINSLCRDVSAKKRLVAVASAYLDGKSHLKRQCAPEDLFFEALERIALGFRKWPKNRLDFHGLVIGVIKSWASSREKTLAREDNHVVMEHELIVARGDEETLDLEQVAAGGFTPFEELEAREADAESQSCLVILRAQFEAGELPARILDALSTESFESQAEAITALGVSEAEYRNAWKRLMRAAKALKQTETEQ